MAKIITALKPLTSHSWLLSADADRRTGKPDVCREPGCHLPICADLNLTVSWRSHLHRACYDKEGEKNLLLDISIAS